MGLSQFTESHLFDIHFCFWAIKPILSMYARELDFPFYDQHAQMVGSP